MLLWPPGQHVDSARGRSDCPGVLLRQGDMHTFYPQGTDKISLPIACGPLLRVSQYSRGLDSRRCERRLHDLRGRVWSCLRKNIDVTSTVVMISWCVAAIIPTRKRQLWSDLSSSYDEVPCNRQTGFAGRHASAMSSMFRTSQGKEFESANSVSNPVIHFSVTHIPSTGITCQDFQVVLPMDIRSEDGMHFGSGIPPHVTLLM